MIRAFIVALQFLSRLPVSLTDKPTALDMGRSACAYPWVGLSIGLAVALVYAPLRDVDPAVAAVALLFLWVLLTGGLHLDGLSDTVDAWVGGRGDREATLRIMKDSAIGAMGAAALVLLLVGKFACLEILVAAHRWPGLLVAPLVGRMALLALLLTTPYVRSAGLGAPIVEHLPRRAGWLSLAAAAAALAVILGVQGLLALVVAGLALWALRAAFVARIGGITGDTLGAACECLELLTLAILAIAAGT